MIVPQKIFSAAQTREADRLTIEREGLSSTDLMERAAGQCAQWIRERYPADPAILVFCGPGNNGGDGLAIARLLIQTGYTIQAFVLVAEKHSNDFSVNRRRLEETDRNRVQEIGMAAGIPSIPENCIVIDALFGTGLSKAVTGLAEACIRVINASGATVIAIDIPSGLYTDQASDSAVIVEADHTLTFEFPKLAFFFPANNVFVGEWTILPLGLDEKFLQEEPVSAYMVTRNFVQAMLKPRPKFSNKGNFGHALLIAGSYGKIGAAVLSASACLRSGAGLLTTYIPRCGYNVMQISNPEAMAITDPETDLITECPSIEKFSAVGAGPGMGTAPKTQKALYKLLSLATKPLVLDADALNILSLNKEWLTQLPAGSILTPHPKEFERMAGESTDDFARHERQLSFSREYRVYLILKGAYTCITTPSGETYFNTSGNAGMAKGGSGDVLTGLLTGLLAQSYPSLETCLLGVFIHGLAGDLAAAKLGAVAMHSGDIIGHLPQAFTQLCLPEN